MFGEYQPAQLRRAFQEGNIDRFIGVDYHPDAPGCLYIKALYAELTYSRNYQKYKKKVIEICDEHKIQLDLINQCNYLVSQELIKGIFAIAKIYVVKKNDPKYTKFAQEKLKKWENKAKNAIMPKNEELLEEYTQDNYLPCLSYFNKTSKIKSDPRMDKEDIKILLSPPYTNCTLDLAVIIQEPIFVTEYNNDLLNKEQQQNTDEIILNRKIQQTIYLMVNVTDHWFYIKIGDDGWNIWDSQQLDIRKLTPRQESMICAVQRIQDQVFPSNPQVENQKKPAIFLNSTDLQTGQEWPNCAAHTINGIRREVDRRKYESKQIYGNSKTNPHKLKYSTRELYREILTSNRIHYQKEPVDSEVIEIHEDEKHQYSNNKYQVPALQISQKNLTQNEISVVAKGENNQHSNNKHHTSASKNHDGTMIAIQENDDIDLKKEEIRNSLITILRTMIDNILDNADSRCCCQYNMATAKKNCLTEIKTNELIIKTIVSSEVDNLTNDDIQEMENSKTQDKKYQKVFDKIVGSQHNILHQLNSKIPSSSKKSSNKKNKQQDNMSIGKIINYHSYFGCWRTSSAKDANHYLANKKLILKTNSELAKSYNPQMR